MIKKGLSLERKVKQEFERLGYTTFQVKPFKIKIKKYWVCKSYDIFGCDLIVMKADKKRCLFIQITYDTHLSRREEKFKKFSWSPGTMPLLLIKTRLKYVLYIFDQS
ncbi:MAG: hypothetical protein QW279_08945, partial [Candidatus Jordarchaeaceae archaeon]